ncbi:MAG: hypothetical protein HOA57_00950 [Candidatus Magasanikbacteria bacterium]|jgi:hypothetical protein|nr:hypothetical protein [Candidatus Magasanikbacteria bacterium]MBT4314501.1 hypothetical protein [Candidatus Magasanikbacteria bacterium]MBT4547293.1 hypothetical protein [Candidatus Magasanikbacteria bacterium]MBT6818938.1 hypothetical protein [Candidatus Magasanikbacteria bacterium]
MNEQKYRVNYLGFTVNTKKESIMIGVGMLIILLNRLITQIALDVFSSLEVVTGVAVITGLVGFLLASLGIFLIRQNKVFLEVTSSGFIISRFHKNQLKEQKVISTAEIKKVKLEASRFTVAGGGVGARRFILNFLLENGESDAVFINPKGVSDLKESLLYYDHVEKTELTEVEENILKVKKIEKDTNSFILKGVIVMILAIILFAGIIVYFLLFYK